MAVLAEATFAEKMDRLDGSQASIEATSAWVGLFRADAPRVAAFWEAAFARAPQAKRLLLLYLASDVLQTSRRRGPEFVGELFRVAPRAVRHYLAKADSRGRASAVKLLRVWDERRVFGNSGAAAVKALLDEAGGAGAGGKEEAAAPDEARRASGSGAAAPAAARLPGAAVPLLEPLRRAEAAARGAERARAAGGAPLRAALQAEVRARGDAAAALQSAAAAEEAAARRASLALHELGDDPAAAEEPAAPRSAAATPASVPAAAAAAGAGPASAVSDMAAFIAGLQNPGALADALASLSGSGAAAAQAGAPAEACGEEEEEEEYDPEAAF
jgi:hypothetical protein